ncbi:MAG TPA: NHL repeat-containing protein [Blastocatellia bacterium]|nr:NHL repeat-containing protein [Blastocatellia bacterium]
MRRALITLLIIALPTAIALVTYVLLNPRSEPTSRDAVGQVTTLAGTGYSGVEDDTALRASFSDPFGVAIDRLGNVFVADGGDSNRIRRITPAGNVDTIAGSEEGFEDGPAPQSRFNTPSGLAIDKRGDIIVADTSNNRIRRIDARGRVSTLAGSGAAGLEDGRAAEAQFDGPLGVAVDREGNTYVADTYNDAIRKISVDGTVRTIAGGVAGYVDGPAAEALFDTPSGVAVDEEGNIFVADTGNDAIRKITPQGEVITFAGGGAGREDGQGAQAGFDRPVGIAVTHDGFLFVTEEGTGRIRRITPEADVTTIAGRSPGFRDGTGGQARFNRPSAVAIDRKGNLYVADTQNYLIRKIVLVAASQAHHYAEEESELFFQPPVDPISAGVDSIIPRLNPELINPSRVFAWPLNPQDRWHEITGVVGEARGAPGGVALHHLHSGLDIRGLMGEPVLSVIDDKASSPIATWDFGGTNEGIHLGLMTYVHVRVGRNIEDEILYPDLFKPRLDEAGRLAGLRVRRGARFRRGDFIGTINQLYHVHMNCGPWNAPFNPIQFRLASFEDTVAPTIDRIEVVNLSGEPFKERRNGRLIISGDVDLIVEAYDQADGNHRRRKLGLYRAGYQLLGADGAPVPGFEEPLINIEFNRLPPGDESVFVVYAPGSGVSAYGTPTRFKYIITNRVRDGRAIDGFLRTSELAPGDYILRIIAEDFAGNRATRNLTELPISITNR